MTLLSQRREPPPAFAHLAERGVNFSDRRDRVVPFPGLAQPGEHAAHAIAEVEAGHVLATSR